MEKKYAWWFITHSSQTKKQRKEKGKEEMRFYATKAKAQKKGVGLSNLNTAKQQKPRKKKKGGCSRRSLLHLCKRGRKRKVVVL